jgi:hypothetical protein
MQTQLNRRVIMSNPQNENQQPQNQEATPSTSGGYQTPIEPGIRKTGVAEQPDAKKPTAVPDAGTTDQPVEGAPNQGTETR